MAQFSEDNNIQARVLVLDMKTSSPLAQDANALYWTVAMAIRLGCYVEYVSYANGVPDKVYSDSRGWDLIVVPWLGTNMSDFTNSSIALAKFQDSSIPVYFTGVYALSAWAVGVTALTGITAGGLVAATSSAERVSSTGMQDWQGRLPGNVTCYCQPYTDWDSTVTAHAVSDANELLMWSKTVSGHPCLFTATYSGAASNATSTPKIYPGFQWMCDQQSSEGKNTIVSGKLKKMPFLLRFDIGNNADTRTAFDAGYLQTTYDLMGQYLDEIHLACLWDGATLVGTRQDLVDWLSARDKSSGGMFLTHNHNTDVVDKPGEMCSSDHIAFDQFIDAGVAYEADCDEITAQGFQLGSNGYGRGYPNVQNGNDMSNPAAMFIGGGDDPYRVWDGATEKWYGGYGCYIWLVSTETYPTYPVSAIKGDIRHSFKWNGSQIIFSDTADSWQTTINLNVSGNMNKALHLQLILGGGFYWHALALDSTHLGGWGSELGQIFTCYPDIVTNEWEGTIEAQQRGSGMIFTN